MKKINKREPENITLNLNNINFCVTEVQIELGKSANCIIQENFKWNLNDLSDRTIKIIESDNEVKSFKYLCNFLFYKDGLVFILSVNEISIINFNSKKHYNIKTVTFKFEGQYDTVLIKDCEYLILSMGGHVDGITNIFKF